MKRFALAICLLACVACYGKVVLVLKSQGGSSGLAENSLRPDSFPAIPSEVTAAGFAPNDLSTSVRTDIAETSRGADIELPSGTQTAPYECTTADRRYYLSANATFDGAGIIVNAANITIDLNGYTLTYNNVDVEDLETATVASSANGTGSGDPPTMTQTGLTLSSDSHALHVVEFTSGDENGNFYEVVSNDGTTLTLENHNNITDDGDVLDSWENGGPSSSDTFRIYDPRYTYGVGSNPAVYRDNVEIVNGTITQGAGFGRGVNRDYCAGMSPISRKNGNGAWTIGGIACSWNSDNTGGIRVVGVGSSITYCELTDNGTVVTNRQRNCACLDGGDSATISYNLVNSHRHIGISLDGRDDCTISYNEVYGDSRGTNAAGVNCYAGEGNTVEYNNIYKEGEHPIGIALHSDGCEDNEVNNNWCESQTTRGSAEYGYNNAVALSDRWGTRGQENYIHDNALITWSAEFDEGSAGEDLGRTLFVSDLAAATSERFVDNFVGAYNTDDSTKCHCVGINNGDEAILYRGNTFVASHNVFWLADDYGYGDTVDGIRFIDNSVTKVGSDSAFSTFDLELLGGDGRTTSADWISNDYSGGAGVTDSDFNGDSADWTNMTLRFGYNVTVTVTSGGSPVEGATVSVEDSGMNTLRSGYTTDANGQVVVDCPTYYRHTNGTTSTALTALTISVVNGMESGSDTISPSSDDTLTVTIE